MLSIMQALATPCSALPKDSSALAASISACRSSISALESSLKTTEGSSGGWETFAWVCSVVVAIGVAAEIVGIVWEYRDGLKDWRRGIVRPPDRPSFLRFFWFEMLATVLVVAGVFGEAWASKELASINSQLRSKTSELRADSDQLLSLVTQEAGDAVNSVRIVGTEADKIQQRLGRASSHLSRVEEAVRAQGPRWLILARNSKSFVRDMKPFASTRITVLMCGTSVSRFEQFGTEQRLLNLLGRPGSNWTAANWETGYESWRECANTSSNGLEMTVGANAGQKLKEAAKALKEELLSLDIATSLQFIPADQEQFWSYPPSGADSPEARAARDPTTIFLLVAPSAMVQSFKPTAKITSRHK